MTNLLTVIVASFQLLTNTTSTRTQTVVGTDPRLHVLVLQERITEHGQATLAFRLPDGRLARLPHPLPFIVERTNYTIAELTTNAALNPVPQRIPSRPAPPVPDPEPPSVGPPLPPGLR